MRLRTILSGCVLLYLSAYSHAENFSVSFRPNFDFQTEDADMHNAIHEVDAGWQGRWKHLPLQERLERQETMIAKIAAVQVKRHGGVRHSGVCMATLTSGSTSAQGVEYACTGAGATDPRHQHISVILLNRPGSPDSGPGLYLPI